MEGRRIFTIIPSVCLLTFLALGGDEISYGASSGVGEGQLRSIDREASRDGEPEALEKSPEPAGSSEDQAVEEKGFDWDFTWEKWDGVHFLASQKIELGDPEWLYLDEQVKITGKIGAKVAYDVGAFVQDDDLQKIPNGHEFRRIKLYAAGDLYFFRIPASYHVEGGFSGNTFYLDETYLYFKQIPLAGTVTVGNVATAMTLEDTGSSRDLTFMEAASPVQAFAPGVKFGVQAANSAFSERITWSAGWFADLVARDIGDASKGFGRAVARLTWLPFYEEDSDSRQLLHLGTSGSYLFFPFGDVRYRSRPESYLAPFLVDTGDIPADWSSSIGVEAAAVKGPFSLQGELIHSTVRGKDKGNLDFNGFYVYASCFLTGESRPYDKSQGIFGRLVPRKNISLKNGGMGAWELGARYSSLDLNDGLIRGGKMNIFMTALNWYWNPVFKIRFNYGYGDIDRDAASGYLHIFQTRMDLQF